MYYGFYNPVTLPFKTTYPAEPGQVGAFANEIGCRIQPADHVHAILDRLPNGRPPTVDDLDAAVPFDPVDSQSKLGWRLERFVADEVLRYRQGALFEDVADENLRALLYGRSAPISAAITISIDIRDAAQPQG